MSRLLLDAHTLVWWDTASPQLGLKARAAIRNARSVFVSAATEWELAVKAAIGKIDLGRSMMDAALAAGFQLLPISFEHAQAVRLLKPIHRDPFDRMLVAVSMVEGLTLVSSDSALSQYPIPVISARA